MLFVAEHLCNDYVDDDDDDADDGDDDADYDDNDDELSHLHNPWCW